MTTPTTTDRLPQALKGALLRADPLWQWQRNEIHEHIQSQQAEIARLREALEKIDDKLRELSDTRPKQSPQLWVDAAVCIEDVTEQALNNGEPRRNDEHLKE